MSRKIQICLTAIFVMVFGSYASVRANAQGNESPTFDVVLIRPTSPAQTGFSLSPNPRSFRVTGATLAYLVQYAFDVEPYQVKGGPEWIRTERFDVTAKTISDQAQPDQKRAQREELLRKRLLAMLQQRFKLRAHSTQESQPGYALQLVGNRLTLPAAKPEGGYTLSNNSLTCDDATTADIAEFLSSILHRTVVDATGDSGHYSITLRWSSDTSTTEDAPFLSTAVREQLGLKLEKRQVSTSVIIIDEVSKPTPN